MKKIIFAIAFALASLPAFAQGALFHDIVIGNNGRPAPSPTYRVCTTPGSPCTGFVSIYSDKALTIPIVNTGSATGDTLGNINFYAAPGDYCVQVSGSGITTYNIGGSSTSCDVRLNGLISTPATVGQGGTGQTTAAAAFNALSPMTTLGDFEYESAPNTASRLPGNSTTTKKYMSQTGNGSVSAAPAWSQIAAADLSDGVSGSGGAVVTQNSPSLVTPNIGAASATSVNMTDQTGLQIAGVQTIFAVAADFTTAANTSLQNITGLSWTAPANKALKIPFECHLLYSQATGVAAVAFGLQDVTIAPTSAMLKGQLYTSATAFTAGNVPALAATTATPIVSATPSVITTVWNVDLDGYIEQPSNASTSAINVMVSTATSGDAVTVKRGSFCKVF